MYVWLEVQGALCTATVQCACITFSLQLNVIHLHPQPFSILPVTSSFLSSFQLVSSRYSLDNIALACSLSYWCHPPFPFEQKHRRSVEANWFHSARPLNQSREDKKHKQRRMSEIRLEKKKREGREKRDGDREAERLLGWTNRAAERGAYFPNTICHQCRGWKLHFCHTSQPPHTPV